MSEIRHNYIHAYRTPRCCPSNIVLITTTADVCGILQARPGWSQSLSSAVNYSIVSQYTVLIIARNKTLFHNLIMKNTGIVCPF